MKIGILAAAAGMAMGAAGAPLNIDNGRQLFVDDFVIGSTNGVVRHWNRPVKAERPVLRPTDERQGRAAGCTVATNGGLWWDPTIKKYRLWYKTDWAGNMRYAESADGVHWTYPDLGKVKGTNRVFDDKEEKHNRSLDSWSVWPDYKAANPYGSWKMLVSEPGGTTPDNMFESSDGRTFRKIGVAGRSGDRTTCHFDAILGKWVFSLRDYRPRVGRSRCFHVQDEFKPGDVPYMTTGGKPGKEGTVAPEAWTELELDYGPRGSLYNFDAVPYESLTLGVMEVLHNTPRDNNDSEEAGLPKQTSLRFGFSRDGRKFEAAPEAALKPEGWGSGKWDTGYLSAIGGICTVSDDELRFYYSALRGDAKMRKGLVGRQPMFRQGMYYNGAIGYATMRRDGFAGMVADGEGELTTREVTFSGGHLFVNAECMTGEVKAEVLGADGNALPGFGAGDCIGLKFADATKREIRFKGGKLSALAGKAVRLRFKLHCATLYSFWVSKSWRGESGGYVAAGGPGYAGLRDTGPAKKLKLVWGDEFNGPEIDRKKWRFEEGFVRNAELQYYTDRKENARIENGVLVIEGRKEKFANPKYEEGGKGWKKERKEAEYTSAALESNWDFTYGRLECRAKLPSCRGTWPAIWTLGRGLRDKKNFVGWPKCGEIDVMEHVGYDPAKVHSNVHGASPQTGKLLSHNGKFVLDGTKPYDGFHTYAMEWDEKEITFFYDDEIIGRAGLETYDTAEGNAFRKPHFILLNLALGGAWGGQRGMDEGAFPQRFEIDWIRVYQRK